MVLNSSMSVLGGDGWGNSGRGKSQLGWFCLVMWV
jgi:hypothetical protein